MRAEVRTQKSGVRSQKWNPFPVPGSQLPVREPQTANQQPVKTRSLLTSFFCLLTSVFCLLSVGRRTAFAGTHVTGAYNLGANPVVMATVNGTEEFGLVFVERSKLVTYNNVQYGTEVSNGYLNVNGFLNDGAGNAWLDLIPSTTASPSDSYYVVTVNIQGHVHSEIWVVPEVATVDAASARQAQPPSSAAPALFYQFVQQSGASLPQRLKLNLTGAGVTCGDDAGQLSTDCTIAGGGGGGSGTVTSVGLALPAQFAVSGSPVTSSGTLTGAWATQSANLIFAGPAVAPASSPAFRSLVSGDIPSLDASKIATGTFADSFLASAYSGIGACAAHTWASTLTRNAAPTCAQPAFSDISGTVAGSQLPVPSSTTLGGMESLAAVAHKWINTISTLGVPSATEPACTDLSDASAMCSSAAYSSLTGTPTLPATLASATHKWLNSYTASTGLFTQTQPDYSDLTGVPTLEYQTVQSNGTAQTERPTVNFISGANATVSCADNSVSSRTDCTFSASSSAGAALSQITAAAAANSINNGDNTQTWNWSLTTASKSGFTLGENVASTATGSPILFNISTLAASTAYPLQVTARGAANGIRVDAITGTLSALGTANINATQYKGGNSSGTGTCTNQAVTALNDAAAPTCTTLTSAYTSGTFAATAHNLLSATHGDTVPS